jgi:hypothetical protein
VGSAGCNFLLLSLAAKGKKVPCVTSSSCPLTAKGKKNTAHSLCNFLLLSLVAKGKFETGRARQGNKK